MLKKISLLVLILLFVGASNVLAFELVEETKTMGITVGPGIALNEDLSYFFEIAGNYNINERLFIKGIIGIPYTIENFSEILISCNPGYVLLENFDSTFYSFGMISNISPNVANIGVGIGYEQGGFLGFFRTVIEVAYTSDGFPIINTGIKYSF